MDTIYLFFVTRKDGFFEKCMPYLSQKKPALYTLRCMDVFLYFKNNRRRSVCVCSVSIGKSYRDCLIDN